MREVKKCTLIVSMAIFRLCVCIVICESAVSKRCFIHRMQCTQLLYVWIAQCLLYSISEFVLLLCFHFVLDIFTYAAVAFASRLQFLFLDFCCHASECIYNVCVYVSVLWMRYNMHKTIFGIYDRLSIPSQSTPLDWTFCCCCCCLSSIRLDTRVISNIHPKHTQWQNIPLNQYFSSVNILARRFLCALFAYQISALKFGNIELNGLQWNRNSLKLQFIGVRSASSNKLQLQFSIFDLNALPINSAFACDLSH